jgi:phage-related protein
MADLSLGALKEKNKIHSTSCWLILLEIAIPNDTPLYIVRNTQDITWNNKEWIAFPFEIGDVKETTEEFPEVEINVYNCKRDDFELTSFLQYYLEQFNGLTGCKLTLRVVNSNYLNLNIAELEENFTILKCSSNAEVVTFKIGGSYSQSIRFPRFRYLKNHCNHRFKKTACGYNGTETVCDKTVKRCRELNNSIRFGGFPAAPTNGFYV